MLEIAGAGTEIGDIVRRSELGRSMTLRSCFILMSLGLLEPIPGRHLARRRGVARNPAAVRARPIEIEPCRDLIVAQFDKLSLVGERDLLGIRADANS